MPVLEETDKQKGCLTCPTPLLKSKFCSLGLPAFKYKKGDVVWNIQSDTNAKMLPCPDCLGSKTISLKSLDISLF